MYSDIKRYHRLQGRFVACSTSEGTLFAARHPTSEPLLNIYAKFFEVSTSGPVVEVSYKTMHSPVRKNRFILYCVSLCMKTLRVRMKRICCCFHYVYENLRLYFTE